MHAVESKAQKAVEDAERRASLALHRAKIGKTAITGAVVAVAEALVDEIGRCRIRLRSARRSVSVRKSHRDDTCLNDSESTDESIESQQRNAAVEEETITNVSAMLDMSAGEVAEVLGLSPTPGAKYAAAAAEAAGFWVSILSPGKKVSSASSGTAQNGSGKPSTCSQGRSSR